MPPGRARVVIIGSGIAGASIAYHLAELGWRDICVLEQGQPVGGTTSHAPGLVGQLRSSPGLAQMLKYSVSLYRELQFDGEPGFFEVGSLRVASSRARMEELHRQAAHANRLGLEAHLLDAKEAGRQFPVMSLDGVEGALHIPSDGSATAPVLAKALIRRAEENRVQFYPMTPVEAIELHNGKISAVRTTGRRVETEMLVIAAGIWSPGVASLAGISLPLQPLHHQYAVTEDLAKLVGKSVSNIRDPDKRIYARQHGNGISFGGYEPNPRTFAVGSIPVGPNPTVQPFDASHFEPLRQATCERMPIISNVKLIKQVNGIESFTPDGEFLLGPYSKVRGLWFATGFCAHGIASAGGVGKALAEWIVNGDPGVDLSSTTPDRFGTKAADARWVAENACRIYGTYYDLRPA